MSVLQILMKGGIMMIPIVICSIIALAILIERLITLKRIQINTRTFVLQVKNRIDEALKLCKETPGPIAAITKAGLVKHTRPRQEIKEAVESAAKGQIYFLERFLGVLGTVAAITPLIGFLGTVTGMIRAFMEIQARGGNVDGIPALIFYNWIQGKVERHVFEMGESSTDLIDSLLEREEGSDAL